MGVDVDPAGGDDEAVGVELAEPRPGDRADLGDPAVVDRDVCRLGRCAGPVDDRPASDHEARASTSPWCALPPDGPTLLPVTDFLDHAVK